MKHFINGQQIAPRNVLNIGLNSDFTGRPSELEVDTDRVILPREALEIVQNHLATQGPFEGLPYEIETADGTVLHYYIDFTENAVFRDYEIEVKIKRRQGKDNFVDRAAGTSFELLAAKGVQFDFIDVPYIIVKDNAVEAALSLGISLFVMTETLIDEIRELSDSIADLIEAITPSVGVGVVTPVGEIISLSLRIAAKLAYVALLIVGIIKLAQQFFELIFPKVRYFQACKVKELLTKGCAYLGFGFESSALDSLPGLSVLPVPLVKQKCSFWDFLQNDLNFAFTKGYPTAQDTTPTLLSLIEAIENAINGKIRVINGVVYLERRDHWQNLTQNQILPALNLQAERQSEYTLNIVEAWKRYYVALRTDFSDLHTLDFFDPTDAEYSTEPVNVINPDLVTIKGLNEVQIPFALGVRKAGLNWLERLARDFFEVIDTVTGIFGGGTAYAAQINNRVGVLQVSQQFYSVTKLMYLVNGKQPADYVSKISAGALYDQFHKINEIDQNDFKIIEDAPVRLTSSEFVNLLNNNYAEINGVICEVLKIQYLDEQSRALITYKEPFNYADGKVEIIEINGTSTTSPSSGSNC